MVQTSLMSQPPSLAARRTESAARLCALAAVAAITVGVLASTVSAQFAPATAPPVAAPVEPIHWKQNLFLIPYQWSSAADPSAAQAVWLLVSKDRGATWQKISEAKPQVKAFNYHAEGDGEYWFALRTIDQRGQQQPPGPYQPELRVTVDTLMPRIESLAAQLRGDGALDIQWRATDLNLDPNSWKFEAQLDASDTWQPLTGLATAPLTTPTAPNVAGVHEGQATWQPPSGARPRALRATVYDLAGNSAAYGAAITAAPMGTNLVGVPANPAPATTPQGWVSASDVPLAASPPTDTPATQPWPAGAVTRAPFRLSEGAAPASGDRVTSYGNPPGVGKPLIIDNNFASAELAASRVATDPEQPVSPNFAPLEPYREAATPFRRASLTRLPAVEGTPSAPPADAPTVVTVPAPQQSAQQLPPGVAPKRVGSRTFALEYELEDFGRGGVAKVELWGTRDGGQSWRSFASDDDHRSPLVATVDGAGLYGFRIVVESAGGAPAQSPRAGDAPELWVDVDLRQPTAELTSIQHGTGNLADHLILQWRAEDDNLDPRPIGLFYSSRPAGPWTAIATNLDNTGEYAWQLQRHVPDRLYLRLEARDAAGNLAAFQTREPVVVPASQPSAQLRDVQPLAQ